MKLSDYIVHFLADRGVKKIFVVTGGACAHIVDSIGQVSKVRDIDYVCVQHEQAGAMAAEAYSRTTGVPGVAVATSGPGAVNLISGICCAWFDSIPALFICGQVNVSELKGESGVRQIGFQETDIVGMVETITKYAYLVTEPEKIRYHLEKAFYEAEHGRPGPVLLDIPMNVQHSEINPDTLEGFSPPLTAQTAGNDTLSVRSQEVIALLQQAKRPVIIAGGGIKFAKARKEFKEIAVRLSVPIATSWSALDLIGHDDPLCIGQYGVYGNRGTNFCVQNADLIIAIGSRLDTRQTGGQGQTFARGAKKVIVDIDENELFKERLIATRVKPDIAIHADAKDFLVAFGNALAGVSLPDFASWKNQCVTWRTKYPAVLPEWYTQEGSVNAYAFVKTLAEELAETDVIIPDEGGNLVWTMQAFEIKDGQQLFSAFAHSPMGYALPAAMGAAFGTGKRIICIDGDGGFQLNIQELQTIRNYDLPIKMFILNNRGMAIMKQFQEVYFDARYEASGRGYSWPNFARVAEAYGIPAMTVYNHDEMRAKIQNALHMNGPVLCDVMVDPAQKLIPKLVADRDAEGRYISKPLEDMAPFLPRDEFNANMIIEPLEGRGEKKSSEIN
ncbi:MAG: thiamine pyrophosphate-binding protein [Candidatus Magasanikbacteria bacterium]|nr:thiamine pyrophosphate-binding protein [Candidatus Magasanikbacteria bacterium]